MAVIRTKGAIPKGVVPSAGSTVGQADTLRIDADVLREDPVIGSVQGVDVGLTVSV